MSKIIEEVYAVFGDDLPSKSDYSAHTTKPFTATIILKEFKTWAKFSLAYKSYAIEKRNKKATKSITKPLKKEATVKKGVESDDSE